MRSEIRELGRRLDGLAEAVVELDHRLLDRISGSPFLRRLDLLWFIATYLGDGYLWALLGVWLAALGGPKDYRNVMVGLGISVVELSLVRGLKLLFGRSRPELLPPKRRAPLLDLHAFPSGHTTLAFAIAYVVARLYPWSALAFLVYALSGLIALSRVYLREHYPLDVLGGAILGTLTAHLFLPLFAIIFSWG